MGFSGRLVLVDDVITRGSTLLGCALAIRRAYPEVDIAGFAVSRTLKSEEALPDAMLAPTIGEIEWGYGEGINRSP